MDKKYLILSEDTKDIHTPLSFRMVTIPKETTSEEIHRELKGFKAWDCQEDQNRARESMYKLAVGETWKYTKCLRGLPDLSSVGDRPFFVFMGKEVTSFPGVYVINKTDYEKLVKEFTSVKLAKRTEEVRKLLYPKDPERIKKLDLEYITAYSLSNIFSTEDHEEILPTIEDLHSELLCLNHLLGIIDEDEDQATIEEALKIIEDLFEPEDPHAYLVSIMKDASEGRSPLYHLTLDTSEIDPKQPETILTFI